MLQKLFFTVIAICIQTALFAQAKPKFGSINEAGVLIGASSNELQVQTINGIRYQSFFVGLGAGLDNYFVRTIPVFIDVRKMMSEKKNAPFLYADGGYSILWEKNTEPFQMSSKGGLYCGLGAGYQFGLWQKLKLLIDCGYSYKRFSRKMDDEPWRSSLPHEFSTYNYSLGRFSVKAGLSF